MQRSRFITTLDCYLFVELSLTILFGVVLFSVIWLAPDTLFKLIQYVFAGKITVPQAALIFAYHIPPVLQQSVPIAVLMGSIFLFQRLSQSYELVAMQASGISPMRMLQSVLLVGLLFGLIHLAAQEWITPKTSPLLESQYRALELKDHPDRNFVFVEKNHEGRLDKFFMIGQLQQNALRDFIILYYDDNGEGGVRISRILRAASGGWNHKTKQWQLMNGIEYVLSEEGVYREIRPFEEQQIRTDKYAAKLLDYSRVNPMDMDGKTLRRYINLLDEGGQRQDIPFFRVRFHQKWAGPLAAVAFALLGALLGMERVRTSRSFSLTFGAMTIFFYSILVPFAANLGSLGLVHPAIVAWFPLVITLSLALLLLRIRPLES